MAFGDRYKCPGCRKKLMYQSGGKYWCPWCGLSQETSPLKKNPPSGPADGNPACPTCREPTRYESRLTQFICVWCSPENALGDVEGLECQMCGNNTVFFHRATGAVRCCACYDGPKLDNWSPALRCPQCDPRGSVDNEMVVEGNKASCRQCGYVVEATPWGPPTKDLPMCPGCYTKTRMKVDPVERDAYKCEACGYRALRWLRKKKPSGCPACAETEASVVERGYAVCASCGRVYQKPLPAAPDAGKFIKAMQAVGITMEEATRAFAMFGKVEEATRAFAMFGKGVKMLEEFEEKYEEVDVVSTKKLPALKPKRKIRFEE